MIIKLPEHLTEASTRALHEQMEFSRSSKCVNVVLDFSEVREMDTTALETILRYMDRVAQDDGSIRVSGMSAEAATFLELTRMDSVFAMYEPAPTTTPAVAVREFAPTTAVARAEMQVSAA
jgi:anti-anti-sigma factor